MVAPAASNNGNRHPLPIRFEVSVQLPDILGHLLTAVQSRPRSGSLKPVPETEVEKLRATLADLDHLPLAALLRELGAILYNRDISQWKVLTDVSDELLDEATLEARKRMTERMIADQRVDGEPPGHEVREGFRARRKSRKR